MQPNKIMHVYSGNLLGGVERMLISMTRLDAAAGQHVFALCFAGKLSRELERLGATVELLPTARIRNPLSIIHARTALKRAIQRQRPHHVICHGIWSYCIFGHVVARSKLPTILYLHDVPEPKNLYYRWAWRSPPSLCIVNSAFTARAVRQLRPSVPIEVVYPLVHPPAPQSETITAALRKKLGLNAGQVAILQASRLDSWKGHRNLLQALGQLKALPAWHCWIAGEPQRPQEESYRRDLLAIAAASGIDKRITFIGHRDDMNAVLAACDVYCQPNETPEPFGMVFVEALYAAKPVVCSALGGALEIVTADCGVLCPPEPAAVARALKSLVENDQLRRSLSIAGPTRALALSGPDCFVERLLHALATTSDHAR